MISTPQWETYSNCISPMERFLTTLVPIVLPFIYFLSEAITYWFKKHEKDTEMTIGQKIGFYCKIVLSFMLWPAFIVFQIAYYTKVARSQLIENVKISTSKCTRPTRPKFFTLASNPTRVSVQQIWCPRS